MHVKIAKIGRGKATKSIETRNGREHNSNLLQRHSRSVTLMSVLGTLSERVVMHQPVTMQICSIFTETFLYTIIIMSTETM